LHEQARTAPTAADPNAFLRLSAGRLAEFHTHCYALNLPVSILSDLTKEQTAAAREALRPANQSECHVRMRAFIQGLKDGSAQ
jgi:hypothetical protein